MLRRSHSHQIQIAQLITHSELRLPPALELAARLPEKLSLKHLKVFPMHLEAIQSASIAIQEVRGQVSRSESHWELLNRIARLHKCETCTKKRAPTSLRLKQHADLDSITMPNFRLSPNSSMLGSPSAQVRLRPLADAMSRHIY